MLKNQPMNVNEMLAHLTIGQATLSSHLQKLRKANLVSCIAIGKNRFYKLNTFMCNELIKDITKLGTDEIILRRKAV
jgi:DNA-binding transcriptional ArsR family regulator